MVAQDEDFGVDEDEKSQSEDEPDVIEGRTAKDIARVQCWLP